MSGTSRLVCSLLYGTGMRLLEGLRLRVRDVDFGLSMITIRSGKGDKDRRTMLPKVLAPLLHEQLDLVRATHQTDLAAGLGRVYMPGALARKYPNAERAWQWQYLFAAPRLSFDPRAGIERRHHLGQSAIQKAVKRARRSGEDRQGSRAAHAAPFLRHPSSGRWLRHPDDPGDPWPRRRLHDDDLHACPEPEWRPRCARPPGESLAADYEQHSG